MKTEKGLQALLRYPEDTTDLTSAFSFDTPAVLEFQFHSSWTVDKNSTSQDGNGVCRMEHDLLLSQTLQHIHQLKYRLKPAPLAVCFPHLPEWATLGENICTRSFISGSWWLVHWTRGTLKFDWDWNFVPQASQGVTFPVANLFCTDVIYRQWIHTANSIIFVYFSVSEKWTHFSHKLYCQHIQTSLLIPPEVSRLVFTYFRILKWFVWNGMCPEG